MHTYLLTPAKLAHPAAWCTPLSDGPQRGSPAATTSAAQVAAAALAKVAQHGMRTGCSYQSSLEGSLRGGTAAAAAAAGAMPGSPSGGCSSMQGFGSALALANLGAPSASHSAQLPRPPRAAHSSRRLAGHGVEVKELKEAPAARADVGGSLVDASVMQLVHVTSTVAAREAAHAASPMPSGPAHDTHAS